ncbi:MAG: V-type ATP synthase subunit I [Lachnospiraceae bacterium]|nr:V-type ATP synthase subunit I [Lachnospiraceae bacterium]
MAVLQMRKLCICGLKKERKPILELLQNSGVVQINKGDGPEEFFEKIDTQVARSGFERNAAIAETALEILDEYAPESKGMFAALEGKREINNEEASRIVRNRERTIQYANKIIGLKKDVDKIEADIVKLEAKLEAITPWLNMDVAGLTKGTMRTSYFYGSLPDIYTQDTLYQKISELGTFPEASDVRIFYSDKNQTCVAGFCMKKDEVVFEEALRSIGFAKPGFLMRSVPAESKKKWLKRLEDFKVQKENIQKQITEMAQKRIDLQNVADYFRSRADKYQILGGLDQSKHTFFVTGYIPAREEDALKNKLEEKYTVFFKTEEVPENEDAPVKLDNGAFGKPVEGVIESFGLPKKGEIDPSNIMAFFYYFLFGMMLSDAAYGFLMAIACFVVLKKFKKMNPSLKKSIQMFMYCGISTLIWGILFGGYFGDAVTIISQTFFNKTVTVPALWFAPLDEPMRLLIYSMAFGLVHMFVGLGLKAYMLIKNKKYLDAVFDVGFWYFFIIGLVMMLVPSELFESISQSDLDYPGWFSPAAYAITILGLVGILFMSGRRKGNKWALRLALGAYDIYGVSSWLSDVLSYSRLLALGLATGVIGSVINLMGSMAGDGIFGAIVFIIVFIVGHGLNMAINILGAYVHTNRLQFVEFFGKFYEGGGEPFEPFAHNTKYVDLSENK